MQKAAHDLERYGVPVPVWPDYTNLANLLQAQLNQAPKGQNGCSLNRPHLHFEVRVHNVNVEPLEWLGQALSG
ncbi:MAG: M23 family metallopeptidase [Chloroflexota bacterium]|nr:M23 family metallopeptidase [Chloroflexota bacterium]